MSDDYVIGINYKDFIRFLERIEDLINISPEEANKKIREYKRFIICEKENIEKQKKITTAVGYS